MPVVIDDNKYRVSIDWQRYNNSWNEIGAVAIDLFGLPGDKFHTGICEQSMDFYFKDEVDAILFSLKVE